jgi:hypothetical protein
MVIQGQFNIQLFQSNKKGEINVNTNDNNEYEFPV